MLYFSSNIIPIHPLRIRIKIGLIGHMGKLATVLYVKLLGTLVSVVLQIVPIRNFIMDAACIFEQKVEGTSCA
jgi:hypothetical protein